MPFIHGETCPECLVGEIEPYQGTNRCNYCFAEYPTLPSEALCDDYWRQCPLDDTYLTSTGFCPTCGLRYTPERLAEVAALRDEGAVAA